MKLNSTTDAAEIRNYLGEIVGAEIDETTDVFTPLYINYGKDIKIGKNVFINFDCVYQKDITDELVTSKNNHS